MVCFLVGIFPDGTTFSAISFELFQLKKDAAATANSYTG